MTYKLLVVRVSVEANVRVSQDKDKLVSKAHELIDTNQASWVMVTDEDDGTVLMVKGE
jgi:transaldolase